MSDPNNRAGKDHKPLKDLAKENPTLIGDPISMKAETSNSEPTDADRPNKSDTARGTQNITNDKTDEKPASQQEPSDNDPEAVEPGKTSTIAPTEADSEAWESEKKEGKSKL